VPDVVKGVDVTTGEGDPDVVERGVEHRHQFERAGGDEPIEGCRQVVQLPAGIDPGKIRWRRHRDDHPQRPVEFRYGMASRHLDAAHQWCLRVEGDEAAPARVIQQLPRQPVHSRSRAQHDPDALTALGSPPPTLPEPDQRLVAEDDVEQALPEALAIDRGSDDRGPDVAYPAGPSRQVVVHRPGERPLAHRCNRPRLSSRRPEHTGLEPVAHAGHHDVEVAVPDESCYGSILPPRSTHSSG
jgi:hypothetical protein